MRWVAFYLLIVCGLVEMVLWIAFSLVVLVVYLATFGDKDLTPDQPIPILWHMAADLVREDS